MTPEQLNSKYAFSKFHIQANYRSPKTIVDLSNQFAQNFKTFEFSAAVPKRDHIPRSVVINEYGHIQDELGAVANEIYALKQQGVPLHDIMVLARSNRTLSAMEPHMLRLGIPYRLKFDNRSPINHSSFRFLYAVYSVVLNPNDVPSLSEMFEACKGFGDKYLLNAQQAIRESAYLQQFSVQAKIATLNQALEKVGNSKQRAQAKSIIDSFIRPLIETVPQQLQQGRGTLDINHYIFNLLRVVFNFAESKVDETLDSQEQAALAESTQTSSDPNKPTLGIDLASVRRSMQFVEAIYQSFKDSDVTAIEALSTTESDDGIPSEQELLHYGFLSELIAAPANAPTAPAVYNPFASESAPKDSGVERNKLKVALNLPCIKANKPESVLFQEVYAALQASYGDADIEPDAAEQPKKGKDKQHLMNKVLLSTVHSAKGSQAPYVLYCALTLYAPIQEDRWDEERCVVYVAITRPQRRLYISSSRKIEDFDGKPRQGVPNPFLADIHNGIKKLIAAQSS